MRKSGLFKLIGKIHIYHRTNDEFLLKEKKKITKTNKQSKIEGRKKNKQKEKR